jgi:LPXTG-motif cell wall-anchored protein
MKKIIFLFLFLLPSVAALSVSPTTLNLGEIERGEEVVREVMVVNTQDKEIEILFRGMYYETSSLDPYEKKVFDIPFKVIDQENGDYIDYLYIQEEISPNVAQALGIKVSYRVVGGEYSNDEIQFGEENQSYSIIGILAGLSLLGVGTFGYLKRKRSKNVK